MELLDSDLPDRRQGQIVDNHQQLWRDETEGTFRSALLGAMSKVAAPLLQERSGLVVLDRGRMLTELMEHSRSPC
jgi:hypothetical protein